MNCRRICREELENRIRPLQAVRCGTIENYPGTTTESEAVPGPPSGG